MQQQFDYSELGHTYLKYANPLSELKIDRSIEMAKEVSPKTILDVGSGNLYLLRKFSDPLRAKAIAVELPDKVAHLKGQGKIPENIELVGMEARTYVKELSAKSIDVSLCFGSTHALANYLGTLKELQRVTRKNGLIIVGEGYWKQRPDPIYLKEFLGGDEGELNSHAQNLELAEDLGLVPLWATTATLEEWDHYEWSYSRGIEDFVLKYPDSDQSEQFLKRIRKWRKGYRNWGRDTLGFGLYVFRV